MPTNEPVPCDMLIFSSSNEDGTCYITTANLDGETNLKVSVIFNDYELIIFVVLDKTEQDLVIDVHLFTRIS